MDDKDFSSGVNFASTASQKSVNKLQTDVSNLEKELKSAKNAFEKSRFEVVTLIGVFVGLITYLGLEIQVFKTITSPMLIIGISIFFIASILLFILTIDIILKKTDSVIIKWQDFNNPLYYILTFLLLFSILLILAGIYDYQRIQDRNFILLNSQHPYWTK